MKERPNLDELINDIQKMIDENQRSLLRYIHVGTLMDILYLLKKQEAVHVKKQESAVPVLDYWRPHGGSHFKCGNCGCSIGYAYESQFCKRCGREVRWPHE